MNEKKILEELAEFAEGLRFEELSTSLKRQAKGIENDEMLEETLGLLSSRAA